MAVNGSLTITPEWAKNVICVEGRGVWSVEQALDHFATLAGIVAEQRARVGMARVLVDLRGMRSELPVLSTGIRAAAEAVYTDEDRVAVLLASAEQRDSKSKMTIPPNVARFDDAFAALRWLNRD